MILKNDIPEGKFICNFVQHFVLLLKKTLGHVIISIVFDHRLINICAASCCIY